MNGKVGKYMEKVKILWSGITGRTGREALELVKK